MRSGLVFAAAVAAGCNTTRPSLPEATGPDAVWVFGREVPVEDGPIRALAEAHVPPGTGQKAAIEVLEREGFRCEGLAPDGGTRLGSYRLMANRWGATRRVVVRLSRPDAARAVRLTDVRVESVCGYGETGSLLTARPEVRGVVGLPAEEATRVLRASGFRVWREGPAAGGRPGLLARYCEEPGLDAGVVRLAAGIGPDGRVTDLGLAAPVAYDLALGILPARGVPFADQPGAYLLFPARAAALTTALLFGAPLMLR
ncbi:MAG: hypothetical protein K2X87_30085 [Gemmataceae bacterium]|nr:hypothetical protein [Gemmataceae bacterium]